MLQASLGIKDHCGIEINDKSLKFIVDYLKQLDVLYPIPEVNGFDSDNKYIFTQIGMRYSQATQQIKALSSNFDVAYLEKLEGDVCGKILEDIILGQLLRENSSNSEASSYVASVGQRQQKALYGFLFSVICHFNNLLP